MGFKSLQRNVGGRETIVAETVIDENIGLTTPDQRGNCEQDKEQ
jgi:hypothetical protein